MPLLGHVLLEQNQTPKQDERVESPVVRAVFVGHALQHEETEVDHHEQRGKSVPLVDIHPKPFLFDNSFLKFATLLHPVQPQLVLDSE